MAGDDLRPLQADPCVRCGGLDHTEDDPCDDDEAGVSYLWGEYAEWDEFAGVAW